MKEIILFILLIVAIFGSTFALVFWAESTVCEKQSVSFEAHRFEIFGGCMVKHKGMWLPLENIRGFD